MNRRQRCLGNLQAHAGFGRPQSHRTALQIDATRNQFPLRKTLHHVLNLAIGLQRLDRELNGATTGQPKSMCLVCRDAIGDDFRLGARNAVFTDPIDQIIFNAASRDRADHMTIFTNSQRRTFRTRTGAPGLDDGNEFTLLAGGDPIGAGFQDFEIDAIHGSNSQ